MVFLLQRVKVLGKAGGFMCLWVQPAQTQSILATVPFLTLVTERLLSLWKAVWNTKQNPERWQNWKRTLKAAKPMPEAQSLSAQGLLFIISQIISCFKSCERCQKDSLLLKLGKIWDVNAQEFYQIPYSPPNPFRGVLKKHIWSPNI